MKYLILIFLILVSQIIYTQETYKECYEKGYDASAQGNFEEAIEYFTKCIAKHRNDVNSYWSRGLAYYQSKQYSKAYLDINKAIELISKEEINSLAILYNIRGKIFFYTENYDDAIKDFDSANYYSTHDYTTYFYRGRSNQLLKNYSKSLKDYTSGLKLLRDYPEESSYLYMLRGTTYDMLNDIDNAIKDYSKSIKLNSDDNSAYYSRAVAYNEINDYNKAIADFTKALEFYKTDLETKAAIYRQRGKSYTEIGQYEKGIADYTMSIKLNPNYYIYSLRGDAKRLSGFYDEAINDFSKSIELNPDFSWAYYRRGWTKEFVRDYNGALKDYNKAIKLDSSYAYTYLNRGDLKTKLYGLKKAKPDYEKILSIENDYREISNCKQYAFFYLGKISDAITWMSKTIEKYPTSGNYYDFACLYSLLNNKQQAIKYLDISIEKGYVDYIHMVNDDYLNNIKFSNEFENLLLKYEIYLEIPIPISDIELNIPETNLNNIYRFALIIGNEDYSSYQLDLEKEVNVDFARNDANTFRQYSIKTLGIPEKNITTLLNATASQIMQGVEKLSKLAFASRGKAEFFLYYAGHGLSIQETKESYIIPVDVSGGNLKYAVELQEIYDILTINPAKRITLFIDACFSGGARNKELIAMRSVKVIPKKGILSGNIIVFASSSGNESSQSLENKKHGLFTYFLLKKLKETKGNLTYKELFDYIQENVLLESILNNNQVQTPAILMSPEIEIEWENWKIN